MEEEEEEEEGALANISCCVCSRLSSIGQNMRPSRWPAAAQLLLYPERGLGDKEAMAAGGRLVKSVAVISTLGQRPAARPSRGLLVWVLVWPEVEGRLCSGQGCAQDRGVRGMWQYCMVELWWGLFLSDNPTLFAAAATGVERGVTRLYSVGGWPAGLQPSFWPNLRKPRLGSIGGARC